MKYFRFWVLKQIAYKLDFLNTLVMMINDKAAVMDKDGVMLMRLHFPKKDECLK